MAAPSSNFIRLRLYFDYPPPAVVSCRMCWLLVDLNTCRVVADLESVIREKFEFSRRSILSLFIEDCYLPHTESIYVVRDNDSVRVKVDCLAQVNGHDVHPDAASENGRKRRRATGEDGPAENGASVEWKKKKRKKRSEEEAEEGTKLVSGDNRDKKSQAKPTEKKKKKKAEGSPPVVAKPAASPKNIPASVDKPRTKKPPVAQTKTQKASSSDPSSSSGEEDEAPKKAATKPPTSTPAASAAAKAPPPISKPAQKKSQPPSSSSSSSETDSSSDEETSVKIPAKNKPLTPTTSQRAPSVSESTNCAQKQADGTAGPPQDSDSEEEIQLVIRRPLLQPGRGGLGSQSPWRGRGRGQGRRGGGGPGQRGRGDGFRGPSDTFESSYNGAKETSYGADVLTNVSVVLQNRVEDAPKRDYSSMPLLAAPPQVGQKIAFKLLELTENYTPEVSEYKEGKIVSFDPTTKQIELELLHSSEVPVEPGKFDLVYQNPDGSERVEYAVSRGSSVTERWESLLEPRLII
ncbi:coilin [Stegastes partitus]|uniref:Coilin n=1 Tax=Stegastes partitus TaxID=144197 RepID=A0A3B4ZYR2_9TELE|nr:PREDICTED: coilin [Stegastes partitus]